MKKEGATGDQSCGVVYVATKLDRYVEEAFLSAESLKEHTQNVSVTLFTDRPDNPLCRTPCFDKVEAITSQNGFGLAWAEGQLDRIVSLAHSPYDRTLHLDTDTRIFTGAVADVFRRLEAHDVAMVEECEEFSYASKHSGRRMFNAGFVLYRRTEAVVEWLRQWEARVRRNFSLALQTPVPVVPELAHVTNEDVRRTLLRMDQIALMEILSPDRNTTGLRLVVLDDTWNYRRPDFPKSAKIVHSEEYKTTKPGLLEVAARWRKKMSADGASRLYEYVASLQPAITPRSSWWPWTRVSGVREEWAEPAMKQLDLHLRYRQVKLASELLADVQSPALVQATQARLALTVGALKEAVQLGAQAVEGAPESIYANLILGEALLEARRPVDAIPSLQRAAAGGSHEACFALGNAWLAVRNYGKAAQAYRRSLAANPREAGAANNLLPALLGMRRYKAALTHAEHMLSREPDHTAAIAFKCVALAELGREPELTTLADHDNLIKLERIPVPRGYQNLEAFNRVLGEALKHDRSLVFEPEGHTTRYGQQTSNLAMNGALPIQQLNAFFVAAAERRKEEVRKRSTHPFDAHPPRVFRLYSWAVIMHENGHQTPHIHARGWLSGVYYVEVPDEVSRDDPERNGWIEFGRSEERWYRPKTVVPVRQIFPEPGLLVTFPSYFWHNTRPLRSKGRRISFAFDIIPV
jgi:tetratricopeptide (TPR) repeat protein